MSLSILSPQFWRVGSANICYFYNFSYLYMPLYQFYTFSTAFMFESKPAHIYLASTIGHLFNKFWRELSFEECALSFRCFNSTAPLAKIEPRLKFTGCHNIDLKVLKPFRNLTVFLSGWAAYCFPSVQLKGHWHKHSSYVSIMI